MYMCINGRARWSVALTKRVQVLMEQEDFRKLEVLSTACGLAEKHPGASAGELLHVATMMANGIADIVSMDGDFDRYRGIRRTPPEGLKA
jgi:predicted nucleic acid-binding protein